jgi:predicted nucleotidyltransferase
MPDLGMIVPKMGTRRIALRRSKAAAHLRPRLSLADALFSGTQQRVLALLFGQPSRSFYATEVIGLAQAGSGAVQRELARLAQSGLVTVNPMGSQKHYQANPASPIYEELTGLVQKTVGLAEPLRQALAPLAAQIHAAFVYGSVAKREDTASSDIDLMVLSDTLHYGDAYVALEELSARLGRTVNPTLLTREEFAKKVKSRESFLTRVLAQPKIWLIGGDDALTL